MLRLAYRVRKLGRIRADPLVEVREYPKIG